jgi:hypothetical protein
MKVKGFIKQNNAVAGVIEALLLVGLVAIILSLLQLYYVPKIMEEREAEHISQVANQFTHLKSVIEIQSTMGVINEENPNPSNTAYTSISSPITLGNDPLPYFITIGATGTLNLIDKDDAEDYKIYIQPTPVDFPDGIPLSAIKFKAINAYYLDGNDVEYILEGGGIILKQSDGEVMKVLPAINAYDNTIDTIEINLDIPLFKGIPGKKFDQSTYSNPDKICYIRTNYTRYYQDEILLTDGNNGKIYIYTDFTNAWNHSLVNDTIGLLWEFYYNNDIDVEIDNSTTPYRLIITPDSKNINLKLTVVEIGVQIGPGIVQQT